MRADRCVSCVTQFVRRFRWLSHGRRPDGLRRLGKDGIWHCGGWADHRNARNRLLSTLYF